MYVALSHRKYSIRNGMCLPKQDNQQTISINVIIKYAGVPKRYQTVQQNCQMLKFYFLFFFSIYTLSFLSFVCVRSAQMYGTSSSWYTDNWKQSCILSVCLRINGQFIVCVLFYLKKFPQIHTFFTAFQTNLVFKTTHLDCSLINCVSEIWI